MRESLTFYRRLCERSPVPANDNSKPYCLFVTNRDPFYQKVFSLLAGHLASEQKVPSGFLFQSQIPSISPIEIDSRQLTQSLVSEKSDLVYSSTYKFDRIVNYKMNLDERLFLIDGIDFFPVIRSIMRQKLKVYNIDWSAAETRKNIKNIMKSCSLLTKYFYIFNNISGGESENGKILIVGPRYDILPNIVFWFLSREYTGQSSVEFVDFQRGYIHYFGEDPDAPYIACTNCQQAGVRNRLVIQKEEMKRYFRKNDISQCQFQKTISKVREYNQQLNDTKDKKTLVGAKQKFENHSLCEEGNIYVLFSHLFYFVPVYDQSTAFSDMCEWIDKTIEIFRSRDDQLLLKPHPVESNPVKPGQEPNETLVTYLQEVTLPDNIDLLAPESYSAVELSQFMDCGLIWRSSAALELTLMDIPCLICGNPPYSVIDFEYLQKPSNYAQLLEEASMNRVGEDLKKQVTKYLYFLEKEKHNKIDIFKYNGEMDQCEIKLDKPEQFFPRNNHKLSKVTNDILE